MCSCVNNIDVYIKHIKHKVIAFYKFEYSYEIQGKKYLYKNVKIHLKFIKETNR